jgi:predicted dehydrogenase
MTQINRRRFLKTSAAFAAGTFAISGTKSSGSILGANERIRMAVAGLHGRGKSHIDGFGPQDGVEIVYVVDPDKRQWGHSIKRVSKYGKAPKAVQNIKEALADKTIDAISIATPNHWHSLMAIWGCQAGKDVYVEKPLSHELHEGRVLVQAAATNKRIVQHGTQSRSSRSWAQIVSVIKQGTYGKLKVARGLCYKRRKSIKFKKPKTPPTELDFNLWLGPAQEEPYHENLVHYNWHWFWNFGNGDIGNQGVHQMDIARWGIPGATLPKSVVSVGGRFGYTDQGQTANTQICVYDYGDTQLIFEVRGLMPRNNITDLFHFEGGTIRADGKFYKKNGGEGEPLPRADSSRGPGGGNHFANFIAAVRSRKESDLNAPVLEGHYSAALCHLGNISYRLGTETSFDQKTKVFAGNAAATETYAKMQEHLKDRGVKLSDTKCRVGRVLAFDAKSERFTGDDEANALLTRKYRSDFAVPEKIG